MSNNPVIINDQCRVADYIETLRYTKRVYVYNRRLPSLAFHLQQRIISINDGSKKLDRELQFEPDNSWKQYLVTPSTFFRQSLHHAVLVVEKGDDLSQDMRGILKEFSNHREVDGWVIYH